MAKISEYIRLMRPYQWVKNGFVFAGLLFGHALSDTNVVAQVLAAFAGFSLVGSAIYAFNDLCDREEDRQHPVKRHRPLAAGTVRPGEALALSGVSLAAGLACAWWASPAVLLMVLIYLAVNIGYSLGLKHVVIVDVFLIASGFMLRLLAGTSGVDIPPSKWLLLCGLMVALFLGFAKRRAELGTTVAAPAPGHRKVLEHYTPLMLDAFIAITATSMVLTYSLYTMSPDTIHIHGTANLIYTVPFVLFGVFRYLFLLYRQERGGDPSRDLVRDPFIMVCVIAWLATTLWLIR